MSLKLIIRIVAVVAVVAVAGGLYKFVFSGSQADAKPRVTGEVYVLPREFLINLADERFAKLNVALVLHEGTLAAEGESEAAPPEGFGPLAQEAVIRDVVTETLTDAEAGELIEQRTRGRLKERIRRAIGEQTDVRVDDVLFTDLAVQ